MSKRLLFIIAYILVINSFVHSQVFTQNIDSIATVDFPGSPDVSDTMGRRVYNYSVGTEYYLVITHDLSNAPNLHVKKQELDGFYNSVIKGILDAAQGKLIAKKNFEVSNLRGAEIEFTSASNAKLPDLRFSRLIFVEKKLIMYSFWTMSANKLTTLTSREAFFNSFKFFSTKKVLKQHTEE